MMILAKFIWNQNRALNKPYTPGRVKSGPDIRKRGENNWGVKPCIICLWIWWCGGRLVGQRRSGDRLQWCDIFGHCHCLNCFSQEFITFRAIIIYTKKLLLTPFFFFDFGFIPLSPPLPPVMLWPTESTHFHPFCSKFNFLRGGRGGVASFANIIGKAPTLLISIVVLSP